MSVGVPVLRALPVPMLGGRRSLLLVERNVWASRGMWLVLVSGVFEPVLYLLALGVGVGDLVGTVPVAGRDVPYEVFVAPAMLASAAMNGAVYESTGNVFYKLKWARTYDAVLATPLEPGDVALGELLWALIRGALYSAAFVLVMAVMGLVESWWGLLMLPAAALVGFAFAAVGLAAVTYMRSWSDFDLVLLATLPLFLFSATFVPIGDYPASVRWLVELSPLTQAVQLMRGLSLGDIGPFMLVNVAYLSRMGLAGLWVASRRFARLLIK